MTNPSRKWGSAGKPVRQAVASSRVPVPDNSTVTSQVLVLARRLQGDYLHKIRKSGLTPSQTRVMRELAVSPGIAQHDLAQRLEIGKVSVGEALLKLEQAGLIARERCLDNRRMVRSTLTPAGCAVMDELSSAAQEQIDWLVQTFGDAKVSLLCSLLDEINQAMPAKRSVAAIE